MKDTEYKLLDPVSEIINDKFDELVDSGKLYQIKGILQDAAEALPGYVGSME